MLPSKRGPLSGLLIFLSFLLFVPWGLAAQDGHSSIEDQVRVAFVHNFLKYVTIPNTEQEITLCVFASSELTEQFEKLSERKVLQRTISLHSLPSLRNLDVCNAVFYAGEDVGGSRRFLKAVGDRPILTIGESPSFARDGGMIRLFRQGAKVRFEINPDAAQERSISISSRLLKLAEIFQE